MGTPNQLCDYLRNASQSSLDSFELARLNASSNLRKSLLQLLGQYVEEEAKALLARWINSSRRAASHALPPNHSAGNIIVAADPASGPRGYEILAFPALGQINNQSQRNGTHEQAHEQQPERLQLRPPEPLAGTCTLRQP